MESVSGPGPGPAASPRGWHLLPAGTLLRGEGVKESAGLRMQRHGDLFQLADPDILHFDFHGLSAVKLQGEDAGLAEVQVILVDADG